MNITAKIKETVGDLKKGTVVTIIAIDGARCSICTAKGSIFNVRHVEIEVTDTDVLPKSKK